MARKTGASLPAVWVVASLCGACSGGESGGGPVDPDGGTTSDSSADSTPADALPDAAPDAQNDTPVEPEPPCTNGAVRECYDGPAGTESRGDCHKGTQTCGEFGEWSACAGQILPSEEAAGNGLDDDCNGRIDETVVSSQDPSIATSGANFWIAYVDLYRWGDAALPFSDDYGATSDVVLVKVSREGTLLFGPAPIALGATTLEEARSLDAKHPSQPSVVEADGVVRVSWIEREKLMLQTCDTEGHAIGDPAEITGGLLETSDFVIGDDVILLPIVRGTGTGGWISALAVFPRDGSDPRVVDVHGTSGWRATSLPEATWHGDGFTIGYSYSTLEDINHRLEIAEVTPNGDVVVGSVRTIPNTTRTHSLRAIRNSDEYLAYTVDPDGTYHVRRVSTAGAVLAESTEASTYWHSDTLRPGGGEAHTVAFGPAVIDLLSFEGTTAARTPVIEGTLAGDPYPTIDFAPANDSFAIVFSWDPDGDGRWEVFLTHASDGRMPSEPVQVSAD